MLINIILYNNILLELFNPPEVLKTLEEQELISVSGKTIVVFGAWCALSAPLLGRKPRQQRTLSLNLIYRTLAPSTSLLDWARA
jgi:hypothetical protein